MRADYYDFEVDSDLDVNSGSDSDDIVGLKAGLAYRFTDRVEGYTNWGQGFHSNDVRGATITVDPATGDPAERVDALVESTGAELGLRYEIGRLFNTTLAAFWLELDSELVFVGDAGTTEPNDATERRGLELTTFWQATDWLAFNAVYAVTDAEFEDDAGAGKQIPGAVESTATLGATAVWGNGFSASTRVRYLGEAPLIEDDSVRSDDSLLVNFGLAYEQGPLELRLEVFNVFDSNDDDISYFYTSRLAGESDEGVEDVHFHPLEPRTLRATIGFRW